MSRIFVIGFLLINLVWTPASAADGFLDRLRASEWANTDFSNSLVDLAELLPGGPPKDGIPAINDPRFAPVGVIRDIAANEPVISVRLGGTARAYPFRILMFHEIVNDRVGGIAVAVTYCPLCNTAVVFDRRLNGVEYEFGVTGWLRNSDMIMFDRTSESWWQQYTGEALLGELAGEKLHRLPARIESFATFREREPFGEVLIPDNDRPRPYGQTSYAQYDSRSRPYFPLAAGELPEDIAPLARVVSVGDRAWSLAFLRAEGTIETEDGLRLGWTPGQNSALDESLISEGWDVGNVLVERMTPDGPELVAYGVEFAFAFHAFNPDAVIIQN